MAEQQMWNPDMQAYMPPNNTSWLGLPSYEYPTSVSSSSNTSATFGDRKFIEVLTQDDHLFHLDKPFPRIDGTNGASLSLLNAVAPVCHQGSGQTLLSPAGGKKLITGAHQDAAICLDRMPGHLSFRVQIAKGRDHGSGWTVNILSSVRFFSF